ncbi:carbohydrate porin [Carboxylicivirga sp. M1479]|uniref:carbohydrate porin n=1 Tax=Carboxylicivirga sp. M1479 TaxID=2594476 RepID=UPI0011775467|nr:carbohydrate porin [Carboxylicivirga sp. M1479]TRX72189.1 carbohydrate porin [Carboxylicivirga sp. M1479]
MTQNLGTNSPSFLRDIKIFRSIILLLVCISTFTQGLVAQTTDALSFEASYLSDYVNSPYSTLSTGTAYMGMIDLAASLNTETANLWPGGEFFFQLQNTHGATASESLVGDLQVFSNIDNGNYTFLYQLLYTQSIGALSLTIGSHDVNELFVASDYGGEYINSSFGLMPTVSMNVMISSFPKPCLGAILQYQFTPVFTFKTAVYEGDPLCLDDEPYNTKFSIDTNQGYFAIAEGNYTYSLGENFSNTYTFGGYYHSSQFDDIVNPNTAHKGNYGLYFIADQQLSASHKKDKKLGSFVKFGIAPKNRNEYPFFWALGLNYYAPFTKRANDVLGLAMASLSINRSLIGTELPYQHKNEQVIECFYKASIGDNISIQPEIQYIINPGAVLANNNTTIGLVRTHITF